MRLVTLATPTGPRAAVRAGDKYIEIAATDRSLPGSVRALLEAGPDALAAVARLGQSPVTVSHPVTGTRLHAPVVDPRKILCIGLNYRDHAIEGGKAIPAEPVLFGKFHSALIGPGEPIVLPRVSRKVDYEAELVVVVGKRGRHIPEDKAFEHVAGYTCGHDVSAR